jgi:zinc transporter ZupT
MHTGAALLASLAVMGASLVGVVFAAGTLGVWMKKYLPYLTTFSAGVFLLISFHLASEAVEEGGWFIGVGAVLLGAALMEGIHFLLPTKHHHHGHSDHAHTPIDGRRVLVSDALHNVGDGVLLVGAFASNIYVGIAATIGVLLHEAVQEISEYFVLRGAGYSHRGALTRNFAVSASILIGFASASYLSSMEIVLALLSGIAAGGFLSVVLHDLLPHAIASVRANGGAYTHVIAVLLGAVTIFGLQTLLPHEEHQEAILETTTGDVRIEIVETPRVSPGSASVESASALTEPTEPVPTDTDASPEGIPPAEELAPSEAQEAAVGTDGTAR